MASGSTGRDPEDHLLEAGPSFMRHGAPFDPAQHGYTIVHNYALYFWRPYLGNTAFALWELLASFCYGDNDLAFPSVSRLARMLTNSDHSRAVVSGRRAKSGSPDGDRGDVKGYQGALARLRAEGLLQVRQRGRGPTARYQFRVLRSLPLLRPDQVAHLSPLLQRDHAAWLERYGIDDAAYRCAFGAVSPADAPHHTPADESTGPEPHSDRGEAQSSTNNPQQQAPIQYWWQETMAELRNRLGPHPFPMCPTGAEPCSFGDGQLTVRLPSAASCHMLTGRLEWLILRLLGAISEGRVRSVRFVHCQEQKDRACAP
jgi:hypothetical protein